MYYYKFVYKCNGIDDQLHKEEYGVIGCLTMALYIFLSKLPNLLYHGYKYSEYF